MVVTRSGSGKMGREYFENLTLEQLHAEMKTRDLPKSQDVITCINMLTKYEEERSSAEKPALKEEAAALDSELIRLIRSLSDRIEEIKLKQDNQGEIISRFVEKKPDSFVSVTPSVVPNILFSEVGKTASSAVRDNTASYVPAPSVGLPGPQTFFGYGGAQGPTTTPGYTASGLGPCMSEGFTNTSVLPAMAPGGAVKLLSAQIPNYSGSEEDDIEIWLRRVDHVALIHGVHESVKLLAATYKLTKAARDWYEMETNAVTTSWLQFKDAIERRFRRRTSFCDIMQKVDARRWNYLKETFHEYVMSKQKLLNPLHLPQRDCINLIIRGVNNSSLRGTAASLGAQTVDELLDKMSDITSAYNGIQTKRSLPLAVGKEKQKDQPSAQTLKSSSTKEAASKSSADITCFYCKAKGHTKAECWKLRKKENTSTSTPAAKATVSIAAAEEATKSGRDPDPEEAFEVGCVREDSRQLKLSESVTEIISVNDKKCSLVALIDTGSPVSFIQEPIYKILFGQSSKFDKSKIKGFRALNGTLIPVVGSVKLNICLAVLPNVDTHSSFQVLDNPDWPTHLVLGRDFISSNNLTLIYKPSNSQAQERLQLLSEIASADVIEEENSDTPFVEIKTDFGTEIDKQVRQVIQKAHNMPAGEDKDLQPVTVNLKDNSVYAYAPRKFAYAERLQIREITNDLFARGIIKESCSPYCARIVPVRKRNGKLRLCVDLRPLNHRVVKQKYPFPVIEDCLSQLAEKNVLTLLDLKESFHSIPIHPDHTKYFSFATPDGQFEYVKLPFGYSESPAEFQKRLLLILQPLTREGKILIYIDDILIPTKTVEENLLILSQCLSFLKQYGFEVNYDKCQFLRKSVEYLGYIISQKGITLSNRHVEAIERFPVPKNVHETQRFIGLIGYFRKFVPHFAEKAKPLYSLLKKHSVFNFNDTCLRSFNELKSALITFPILQIYNPRLETELHTDASSVALAAILLQKQDTGFLAPVAYFSQATNSAESRYHSFELEMLAVVRAIERFHIYLYGITFVVITDCHAVVYAIDKANLNPRIARWTIRLQSYDFKIKHRQGNKMSHVDALSRAIAAVDTLPTEVELQYRQFTDSRIQIIAKLLEQQPHDKFELVNGLVYRKCSDNKLRFYVPDAMVSNILRVYHDNNAHCGAEKTFQGIQNTYWFPSMRKAIYNYIENCLTCLVSNSSMHVKEGELQIEETPDLPISVLHVDHFGPLIESSEGSKHILVLIDAFTRFTWLFPVRSTSTKETIGKLAFVFNIFGNPSILISDRGTCFTSFEFSIFTESRNIKHRLVAVAAPWANGLVERVNRFLKSSLKKVVEDQELWSDKIADIQYVINNTYHSATKCTPSKLLLGYDQRNSSDSKLINFLNNLAGNTLSSAELLEQREKNREMAKRASDKVKTYNKTVYDKRHKQPTQYQVNDYVLIRDTSVKPGENKKLKPTYRGPYQITKVLNKNRYVV